MTSVPKRHCDGIDPAIEDRGLDSVVTRKAAMTGASASSRESKPQDRRTICLG